MTRPDVPALLEEARSYLVAIGDLDEGAPVPRDEVVAQLEATGYGGGRNEPPASEYVRAAIDAGEVEETDTGLVATDEEDGPGDHHLSGNCVNDETNPIEGDMSGSGEEKLEPAKTGDMEPRGADSPGDDPEGETAETDEDLDKYRRVYLDAAERAGREPWEPVEEEALREALAAIGFEELLDNGTLFDVHPWRFVDVSDDDEEPRRRWYYPSGDEPRPDEFRRFDALLREAAPDGYEPHYFRVARAGKDPATQYGSWKTDDARVTVEEAVEWMKEGGNVGVAGRGGCRECGGDGRVNGHACPECDGTGENAAYDGPLVNVDIDDDEETTPDDVPASLRARSRSRTGWHTWFFDEEGDIPNIPTDEYGEVRTNWQYVVAPGSFVASCREEIPDDAEDPGYYTVEDEEPVASIEYDDLPQVFRDFAAEVEAAEEKIDDRTETETPDRTYDTDGDTSAVFDVEAADLVSATHDDTDRFSSIFHGSGTGANMSVSGDKVHCWRHGVAHGGLQALATLSDVEQVSTYGCDDLGAAHKNNSGAGSNRLKGDWRLVWGAWYEAKSRNAIPDDDPVPYRVLRELAVDDGLVERDDLVERDADTGEVADEDADETYLALPSGTYNDVLQHVRDEYDVDPGREEATGRDTDGEEYDDDPREADVTVDPRRAWAAAGRVEPTDLDDDRLAPAEGDAFACPECSAAVDVVRAVAVAEGLVETCDDPLDAQYPEAYTLAREAYGAPLPEYYTTTDAIAEFDAVLDVIGELSFFHLDSDALATEVTASDDEVDGEAVRALDPAWRDSESGESVLVFDSGTIWDADTKRVVDVLRFVALDSGLLDDPREALKGEDFTEAYGRARTEYGAPLPRWEPAADGAREITPQLPPSDELVDARDVEGVDPDALEAAREDVEALIADAAADDDTPTVVTALPATGKTTGTVKTAQTRALSYLAPRKELQAQALAKADRWGVDAEVLPVFSEERVRDEVLAAAVSHVREEGKGRLRDRWSVLAAAFDGLDDEEADDLDVGDIFDEDDDEDDDVDLDRPTCETAEGNHGVDWALAVHVARRLGYTPREIHNQARGLFGAPLPCDHAEGETCEYADGWDRVTDPDATPDLLVGSYVHAHVESVRTEYTPGAREGVDRAPRAVVLDEFPGEAFVRDFDAEAEDHATWLARCLREDVADRRDMLEADLAGDDFVTGWLEGREGDDPVTADLARVGDHLDARNAAEEILDEVERGALEAIDLAEPLETVAGAGRDATDAFGELDAAIDDVNPEHPASGLARWADGAVRTPLARATLSGSYEPTPDTVDTDALGIGADLEALVDEAVDAARERRDGAAEAVDAAVTALRGGREGCRRLAAWATDGYAHPDAHHLLAAVVEEEPTRVDTSSWAFDPDATDGTVVDVVETGARARTVLDRNGHGARIHTPPSRASGSGDDAPLVGLDATGRAELWSNALGEEVATADIHDTPEERAAFLEDALDLRVLQAADRPRPYEGDPTTKDTDGDVALLEAIDEEYSGLQAPRERGDDPVAIGKPAAITTKGVRGVLENDTRLDDVVAEWENYGNLTGDNQLGNHRLAAILGSQHYGDHAIERFCALAGEEVDTDRVGGRGADLEYGSGLANAYLQHMREDQTMQAILRFTRGDSGATVVARTSALREDLPVVGDAQVVETWSDTATSVARAYRRLGAKFTIADVADAVDVTRRQVRRVLAELADAGYIRRVGGGSGVANVYEPADTPGAGEVDLPEREAADPGHTAHNQYYTWNVRVFGGETAPDTARDTSPPRQRGAPPAPTAVDTGDPPT